MRLQDFFYAVTDKEWVLKLSNPSLFRPEIIKVCATRKGFSKSFREKFGRNKNIWEEQS